MRIFIRGQTAPDGGINTAADPAGERIAAQHPAPDPLQENKMRRQPTGVVREPDAIGRGFYYAVEQRGPIVRIDGAIA